jgi:molecular chaperone GrpE
MSNENNSEITLNEISGGEIENQSNDEKNLSLEKLNELLEQEKQKSKDFENKLKHVLADYQNLTKKTQSEIENGINNKIAKFMIDFLKIYDDLARAREVFSKSDSNTQGLDSIIKNMNSFLEQNNVIPIDALGEIFDPNLHEAISIITDPKLDDNTITKEIRKGYISQNKVIRPSLVEISKKGETKNG